MPVREMDSGTAAAVKTAATTAIRRVRRSGANLAK